MRLSIDRKVLLLLSAVIIAMTLAGGLFGSASATEGTYDYLRVFNEALYLAMNNYVEPVQIEALMEGAYRGMLESLDPGNEYLSPTEYEKASRGEHLGPAEVGLHLSKRHGYAIVIATTPGGPGAAAGVKSGDILLSIDGRTTRTMGPWEAAQALRGRPGSKAVVVVNPGDGGDRKTVSLERKVLAPPQPVGGMVPPEVGVVRIAGIREGDARRLDQTITQLRSQGMRRLLLDLRGCVSESLAEPIGIASLFVEDGVIVSVSDRYDGDRAYRADGRRRAWTGPLALLVDGGTSRGCEALTAGLRDAAGAAVLGERTWGIGSIYSILPLRNGDGVILAVGTMHSPTGKDWNGRGIDPDLVIALDDGASGDPQRQKAIEYLRGISTRVDRKAA